MIQNIASASPIAFLNGFDVESVKQYLSIGIHYESNLCYIIYENLFNGTIFCNNSEILLCLIKDYGEIMERATIYDLIIFIVTNLNSDEPECADTVVDTIIESFYCANVFEQEVDWSLVKEKVASAVEIYGERTILESLLEKLIHYYNTGLQH